MEKLNGANIPWLGLNNLGAKSEAFLKATIDRAKAEGFTCVRADTVAEECAVLGPQTYEPALKDLQYKIFRYAAKRRMRFQMIFCSDTPNKTKHREQILNFHNKPLTDANLKEIWENWPKYSNRRIHVDKALWPNLHWLFNEQIALAAEAYADENARWHDYGIVSSDNETGMVINAEALLHPEIPYGTIPPFMIELHNERWVQRKINTLGAPSVMFCYENERPEGVTQEITTSQGAFMKWNDFGEVHIYLNAAGMTELQYVDAIYMLFTIFIARFTSITGNDKMKFIVGEFNGDNIPKDKIVQYNKAAGTKLRRHPRCAGSIMFCVTALGEERFSIVNWNDLVASV